ncbi:MAG: phosphatase PAP2 family protein [Candidatus Yonathbacteria bacterium]|nr:phosphatase PAP2 family protein [Candidatus Yonathbacteria bacterium]NTW47697.1 phosphatase PAP2 family protein [Candidatus Yonathbacteria bacterium]
MNTFLSHVELFFKNALNISFVKRFLSRYPRSFAFIKRRVDADMFEGLPLTLLTLLLCVVLAFLASIVEGYVTNEALVFLDTRLANLLYAFRSDGLLAFFHFLTYFSEGIVIVAVMLGASIVLWQYHHRVYIPGLWLSVAIGQMGASLGKLFFQRLRPDEAMRAIVETSFSFPSGHASTVVPLYGYMLYLVWKSTASLRVKRWSTVVFVVLVLGVDFSRLYLGVHYLSDVLAGNLLGFAALIIGIGLTEWVIDYRDMIRASVTRYSATAIVMGVAAMGASAMYGLSPAPVFSSYTMNETQPISLVDVPVLFSDMVLPQFTEDIMGASQEPINLIVIAPRACFTEQVRRAGWVLGDDVDWKSMTTFAKRAALDEAYPTAPMTPSFFNAMPHTYGFQKETEEQSARSRHHARFWRTAYDTPLGGLYVGTVSLDVDIKWGVLTHEISPDIDTERDVFVNDLVRASVVTYTSVVPFVAPTTGENFAGDNFFTSGHAAIIVLDPCGE